MLGTLGKILRYGPMLLQMAILAVQTVEALGAATGEKGDAKRALAVDKIEAMLAKIHVSLPESVVGAAVDLVVWLLNIFTARSWTKGAEQLGKDAAAATVATAEAGPADGVEARAERELEAAGLEAARAEFARVAEKREATAGGT